jgi:hypothetical protein
MGLFVLREDNQPNQTHTPPLNFLMVNINKVKMVKHP